MIERDWAQTEQERCEAFCIQRDDHWGGIRNQCDLFAAHKGEHAAHMDACDPLALLVWGD